MVAVNYLTCDKSTNVYRMVIVNYFTCDKSVQWVKKSLSQISISELCARKFLKCRIRSMSSVLRMSSPVVLCVCEIFLYCFTEKLHSSFIFDSGGQVAVVSTDFDFTLLYKLIRNVLIAIPAPTCGWGNPPSPGHVNKTDDIERIL
jgi:hypothetical protein